MNADVSWAIPTPTACDPLRELCQAFVMVELLDPAEGFVVILNYEAGKCVVSNTDSTAWVLEWKQPSGQSVTSTNLPNGTNVALRITMRDAVLYSVGYRSA